MVGVPGIDWYRVAKSAKPELLSLSQGISQFMSAEAVAYLSSSCPSSPPSSLPSSGRTLDRAIMATNLTSLAPELIACILDVVPSTDLQRTTLSLLCVLSYSSVPNWRHYLFCHVQLRTPEGVSKLIENFKRDPGNAAFVQKLTLASWTVDAKVATEAILMLPKLKWLSLYLGVSFTPEYLKKLLQKPMSDLRYLSLRLRP